MPASDHRELARHALEYVCSGNDASAAVGVYSRDFRDQVNASDYSGHDGIRQSLGLYQLAFSDGDLQIRVEGIVISRIDEGEIVEDWAASDNLHLIRQLGPWRLLLLGLDWLRRGRRAYRASPIAPTRL